MRSCVYVAVFGAYNPPPSFPMYADGVDYIFFSDKPVSVPAPWQLRLVKSAEGFSAVELNRTYKMHPHRYLADYELSLYLDGNITVNGDLTDFLSANSGYAISAYLHPLRNNILQEAAVNFRLNRLPLSDLRIAAKQLRRYIHEGYPDVNLIEANILLRRHDNTQLNTAMEMWWGEFESGVKRDQLSLGYVLWTNQVFMNFLKAPDRRKLGGLFYCKPHPKFSLHWIKGWLPRKCRMLTTSNQFWEVKIQRLMREQYA